MSTKILAGTPWLQRGLERRPRLSEVNTYATSAVMARLAYIEDGVWSVVEEIPAQGVGSGGERLLHFLTFSSDVPAIFYVAYAMQGGGAGIIPGLVFNPIVLDQATITAGSIGGITLANLPGIPAAVPGFGVRVALDGEDYSFDDGRALSRPSAVFVANSASVEGPPYGVDQSDLTKPTSIVPVFLRSSDYTDAIRTANNQFAYGSQTAIVVGLWSLQS